MALRFGTAGVPLSAPEGADTSAGIEHVKKLGLGAMEVEFVRQVYVKSEADGERIRASAEKSDIALSIHAPYFVNLNSPEKAKLEASKHRILSSAKAGHWMGARNIVIHSAFYLGMEKEQVYARVKSAYIEMRKTMAEKGWDDVILRPELMGKPTQFGNPDEIIRLSSEVEGVLPCLDFAHYEAYYGEKVNNYEGFRTLLEKMENALGKESLKDVHFHFSGIEYTDKGERNHLPFDHAKIRWKEMVGCWKDFGLEGTAISESPNIEGDALKAKNHYDSL
ncbi:MAG: TIM barrel protein [Candidatus Bilamarchaeaceae archaeon]